MKGQIRCRMCGKRLPNEDKRVYSKWTRAWYCLPGKRCDESPANRRRVKEVRGR